MTQDSIPRPEYPRPQFERTAWLNLNGVWEFEMDPGESGEQQGWTSGKPFSQAITVPFPPESTLSGIGHTDFMSCVWYRRTFSIPETWANKRILLHFGAVDYDATVWVNGTQVCRHRGGYTPFVAEITSALKEGENEVVVRAVDHVRSGVQPVGKQSGQLHSAGCRYTRVTGIWQTVWLEAVPKTYLEKVRIVPDLDNGQVFLQADVDGPCKELTFKAIAKADGSVVGEVNTPASWRSTLAVLKLDEIRTWELTDPFLYDLELTLEDASGVIDRVHSYFGLRKVHLDGNRIYFNNRPIFQRLVLDQGFYPDGIYTAPSDEALKRDVEISLGLGFNGARLHQKVFESRFLYWADRLGYLIWGEFPNWGASLSDAAACENILAEWVQVLNRDLNHPSIIGWCPFNETPASQRNSAIELVYQVTRAIDPIRPIIDTSGYTHVITDVYDCHDYTQDIAAFQERQSSLGRTGVPFYNHPNDDVPYAGQPYMVSEYGGTWWNPGQKEGHAWGYGENPKDEQEFIARYRQLTETLLNDPAMSGFCYTQLYDIEQEVNGLYTYHRKPKFDPEIFRKINTQKAACE